MYINIFHYTYRLHHVLKKKIGNYPPLGLRLNYNNDVSSLFPTRYVSGCRHKYVHKTKTAVEQYNGTTYNKILFVWKVNAIAGTGNKLLEF